MLSDVKAIHARVEQMQRKCVDRDRDIDLVRLARNGDIDRLHPDLFSDDMPKSVVANIIDTAARDTAELMAPLPALACTSGNMVTSRDKERAAKKNKIGAHYWQCSHLAVQNYRFCDSLNSYRFGTYLVEADFESKKPRIRFESPFGAYYYKDRWGNVRWYAKITETTVGDLAAAYPEHEARILDDGRGGKRDLNAREKMVRYHDKDQSIVYLPDCGHLVLARAKNPLSRIPVVIAERPSVEDTPSGQYDDVVYPYLAQSLMGIYKLKAADQSVNAPWVFPTDVTELPYGPDAALRSQEPHKIGRVPLAVPNDVFRFTDELDRNIKEGARYPDARTGGVQGSIVTGRGVEALMGTMDTMLRTMQTVIAPALEEATSLCFEMDAVLWPNKSQRIEGVMTGKPFEITYVPSRDIGDSWGARVTYGFAAGLSPAQAMVALLQLRGDDQISRDTARRQLPFDIDPEEEQRAVDVQQLEDSLKQGLSAFLQAMGPMVMQGGDPRQLLTAAATVIDARQKGKALSEAILEAFPEPEPQPAEAGPALPGAGPGATPMATAGGELPQGLDEGGLMEGVPYGQAGEPPGGMPTVQSLLARLRGQGAPVMEASVSRRTATGD